jgi:hypothetical protein
MTGKRFACFYQEFIQRLGLSDIRTMLIHAVCPSLRAKRGHPEDAADQSTGLLRYTRNDEIIRATSRIRHTGFVPSGRLVYIGGHYPASLWHTTPWMAFLAGWATTARIRI